MGRDAGAVADSASPHGGRHRECRRPGPGQFHATERDVHVSVVPHVGAAWDAIDDGPFDQFHHATEPAHRVAGLSLGQTGRGARHSTRRLVRRRGSHGAERFDEDSRFVLENVVLVRNKKNTTIRFVRSGLVTPSIHIFHGTTETKK